MISITIPTYNRAHLIPKAIESIINQSVKDWELIIVDDGSTDNTEEVVKGYLSDERIKYLKKKNTGAGHSRNVGAEHAKFDWITFLDSDDEALPNWLAVFRNDISQDTDVFTCGSKKYDHNNNFITEVKPGSDKLIKGIVARFGNGGNFFLKKDLFNRIGGYDSNLPAHQNTDLVIRVMQEINFDKSKVNFTDLCLIKVNIHLGHRIRTDSKAKYTATKMILEKHQHYFLSSGNQKMLSTYYAVMAYDASKLSYYKASIKYQLKAIGYYKIGVKNYLRLIRYFFKL